jgi:hypothetical protein
VPRWISNLCPRDWSTNFGPKQDLSSHREWWVESWRKWEVA